jgi:hypothetical protein
VEKETLLTDRSGIRDLLIRLAFVKDPAREAVLFEELNRSVREARKTRAAQHRRIGANRETRAT